MKIVGTIYQISGFAGQHAGDVQYVQEPYADHESVINLLLHCGCQHLSQCRSLKPGYMPRGFPTGGNVNSNITDEIQQASKKLSELIRNSLAMFQTLFGNASLENTGLHSEQRNNFTVFKSPTQTLDRCWQRQIR
uniref:Uncharacterized protein n=1 Tax=Picea sitchensis TaxID=3332 RepID=D5AB85_PICSI|nr:unknown [Picea sitchensis]